MFLGCSSHNLGRPADLELRIHAEPRQIHTGDSLVVTYTLRNAGSHGIKSCFSFKNGLNIWSDAGIAPTPSEGTSHPACVESFSLAPLESVDWRLTRVVPDLGKGRIRLSGWVKIIADPSTCDHFGCDEVALRSLEVEVFVVE